MNPPRLERKEAIIMETNDLRRFSLCLTPDLENAILTLRQKDEYRRCSLAEIMRRLLEAGLEIEKQKDA